MVSCPFNIIRNKFTLTRLTTNDQKLTHSINAMANRLYLPRHRISAHCCKQIIQSYNVCMKPLNCTCCVHLQELRHYYLRINVIVILHVQLLRRESSDETLLKTMMFLQQKQPGLCDDLVNCLVRRDNEELALPARDFN